MTWLGVILLVAVGIYTIYNAVQLVKEVKARKSAAPCDDNNQEKEKK